MVDKKTLSNYRAMEVEMAQLEELIARMEARILEPKTSKLSSTPKGGGNASDVIASNIARLHALRDMYNQKWDELLESRRSVESAIDNLPPKERTLMRYRYVEALSWKKIAKKMGYSEQHVKNLHLKITKKLTK